MTHREIAELVARWSLRQAWAALAAYETAWGQGVVDVLACTDPRRMPVNPEHAQASRDEARAVREAYHQQLGQARGRVRPGALRAAAEAQVRRRVPVVLPDRRHEPSPRVVAIEVKRTRADLRSDLRARKLLKYAHTATHCYLAGTPEAFGSRPGDTPDLDDLAARGLPRSWGVILVPPVAEVWAVRVLRPAKRVQPATPALVYGAAWAIAQSLSHRVLAGAV